MATKGTTYVLALMVAGDAVRTLGALFYIKCQPSIQGPCQSYHISLAADAQRIRSGTPLG